MRHGWAFIPRRATLSRSSRPPTARCAARRCGSELLQKPTGFREDEARWLLDKELNLMGGQALGMGLGTLIREMGVRPEIVTGHDFRAFSTAVKMALVSGLMAAGCKVHDIGL